jgi:hypothetical protein
MARIGRSLPKPGKDVIRKALEAHGEVYQERHTTDEVVLEEARCFFKRVFKGIGKIQPVDFNLSKGACLENTRKKGGLWKYIQDVKNAPDVNREARELLDQMEGPNDGPIMEELARGIVW